jgi:cytochrome c oxidase subunit IV
MDREHSHIRLFVSIFILLLILVGLTVEAARHDLGKWSLVVALAIAATKALLIALYFMHVRESRPLTKLFAVAGLFWLGILFTFSLADYRTRDKMGSDNSVSWSHDP